ncbi:MAG: ASKHA domain-containing protein [Candidatus Poribacteria bacterium]|nr:ASKHA domain-containing protein [Candidatus Poribacteria bacterium]
MKKIDKAEYEKRLNKITQIFEDMVVHADEQATYRCPYKNRYDHCTAKFGCRNQRKIPEGTGLLCVGDDKLDYRDAWETDENNEIEQIHKKGNGTITCDDKVYQLSPGKTVFDYADDLAVQVPTSCFRTGQCHECIVEIKRGMESLRSPNEAESFLRDNFRLACQAVVLDIDADIEFSPLRRTPRILTHTESNPTQSINPLVTQHNGTVHYNGEPVDRYRGNLYGLALDLGTTTVVANLVDLETGETVSVSSFENPQRFGGSDIMHRISYDGEYEGELRKSLIAALNGQIMDMCERHNFVRQEIYDIVVAGNTTMRDIFFRQDVQSIGQKPYKSVIEHEYLEGLRSTTTLTEKARRIGIRSNPKAMVYSLPLIASHVGADVAADLVAVDMQSQDDIVMLIDVGTNTEVVVGNSQRMVTASCPAGPAFEGGGIEYGMPAYPGAIESVKWIDGKIDFKTIGDENPQGLCGSGLISLLAELRRHNEMSPKGVFADRKQRIMQLLPEHGITFSRDDASNLAQAKAANYCGQYIVLRHFGCSPQQISRLYLAGGFANYINLRDAIDIGFLAPVPEDRIAKVGNASVGGATAVLLSKEKRSEIESFVKNIEHIELETTPDFFDVFVEGCQFKPMPTEITKE